MTRYLLVMHSVEGAPDSPDEETQRAYSLVDRVNSELQVAGAGVFGRGLPPPDSATVIRVENGKTTTTDWPFAETKEQLGEFWERRERLRHGERQRLHPHTRHHPLPEYVVAEALQSEGVITSRYSRE